MKLSDFLNVCDASQWLELWQNGEKIFSNVAFECFPDGETVRAIYTKNAIINGEQSAKIIIEIE